ncbi:MAG: DsbA family oxidoreductase [Acidimicrobiia bacterium]|nr:DsbA family oxidoreductase [Acidimicrobiia bacterium]
MLVEIYSDIVCPWCYIGQHQFGEAVDRSPYGDQIETVWRAFQLDPRAPAEPTSVFSAYAKKFGSEERAEAIIERITAAANGVGLEMRLDQALRVNTFDAHRLVWSAHDTDLQWPLERRLMEAYFVEARNVADHATLIDIAEETGLDSIEIERFLESDGGRAEVLAEMTEAAERDVTAIPTFFFNRQVGIPGAQDADTFERIIERAVERLVD